MPLPASSCRLLPFDRPDPVKFHDVNRPCVSPVLRAVCRRAPASTKPPALRLPLKGRGTEDHVGLPTDTQTPRNPQARPPAILKPAAATAASTYFDLPPELLSRRQVQLNLPLSTRRTVISLSSVAMRISLPSSSRRSSSSSSVPLSSPVSPSGSSPASPLSPPPHAHLHRSRRRSAHALLSRLPAGARQHRWLVLSLLATITWLALSRRTVPFFVLGSTYLLSSSYPTPVLGSPPDGFDLVNLHPAPGKTMEVVPRVIHQVRLGGLAMRPAWEEARASCVALHPASEGWEFRLWEDAEGDAFVKADYPELFDLYRGYEQEIMRSNVLRYLVLHKFGGVYRASLSPPQTAPTQA